MSDDSSVKAFDPTAVPIRDASTVLLVRDSARGIEVFLQRRVVGMDFAGGMTVFPGGGVDPSDTDAQVRWTGPDVAWWAVRFGVDEARARALVLAAVRETFEECGVLLAGPTPDTVVADTAEYADARRALEARELSFGDFLEREGLVLRADLLRPQANWITPLGERRRYDTRFFTAVTPEGQRADGNTSETDLVQWRTAQDALDDWRAGRSMLLPPTWSQLTTLTRFGTVAELMASEAVIDPIEPVLTRRDGVIHVEFDGCEAYYEPGMHPWAKRADI
ncbi:NUDIX domain-containing protein [Rhodococcus sp. Z13]|uniref:NUDIX domain-containing protein n=1 Tax=Rhodococcus sacchari TaxID=2962047 RepID=A0ACD4DCG2_9NOCA|nr:NUDIX domain-containing protein [Rhodococcus sp. Z13]UYP17659.1 NUDIX domain-containing protein [Rhodococcus sp. Z13]